MKTNLTYLITTKPKIMDKLYNFLKSTGLIILLMMSTSALIGQDVITKWTFEGNVLTPAIGTGTASNVGGTSTAYATGYPSGGSGWNTSNYPPQGTGSGTAGVMFTVSTVGYENITVSWVQRHSNTAANRIRLKYTIDGVNWQDFQANETNATNIRGTNNVGFDNGRYIADAGDQWFIRSANFSQISGVNNNSLFAVRMVTEFTTTTYGASNPGSTYGPTGTLRYDDVTFSGTPITTGVAIKLAVISVNNGVSPTVNIPFNVVVQSLDDTNAPANVTTDTEVTLSVHTGTGSLSGTLTGLIPAGNNLVTFSNITYNVAQSGVRIKATATSGMNLQPGISDPFEVLAAASFLKFVGVPSSGNVNVPIAAFTVEARRPDNTIDNTYSGAITISKNTGPGSVYGTLTVNAVQGIATFTNVRFNQSGTYTIMASAENLDPDYSGDIQIIGTPEIVGDIVPMFISANTPASSRIPYAFRATFNNLLPNATYRYINQAVVSGDTPTTGGAGNPIFVTQSGSFYRTTSPSFTSPLGHGLFTTDNTGSASVWFILEPTTNARFTPGNEVFMRIRINDGAGGTTVAAYLTINLPVTVIGFSTDPSSTAGTAFYATSQTNPKNFAFLYGSQTENSRPLFGTSIETTGVNFAAIPDYAAFYRTNVSGIDGAFGGILPNVNPDGVRLIEERSLATGNVVKTYTSSNGIWGTTNTVNPTGGLTNILVFLLDVEPQITVVSPNGGEQWQRGSSYTISWNSVNFGGNVKITLIRPPFYTLVLADNLVNTGSWVWNISPTQPLATNYKIRIQGVTPGDPMDESDDFFSIIEPLPPSVTVVSPNGGELIVQGTVFNITWSTNNYNGTVNLELIPVNPPAAPIYLGQATAGQLTFAWSVTQAPGQYLISIYDAQSGTPSDQSDAPFSIVLPPNIVITEIMYNPPEVGTDILEYVELYNAGGSPQNLQGWYFSKGFEYTFPSYILNPGEYVVVAVNSAAMLATFGVQTLQWTSGALNNAGEELELKNAQGQVMDYVFFKDVDPWPKAPDGYGPSLVLKSPLLDNNIGENWASETFFVGYNADGIPIYGTPGGPNLPSPAHSLLIPSGWGGISTYVSPGQPSVQSMFQPIVNDLVILQNFSQLYLPGYNVNTIGNWNSYTGYQLKINQTRYHVFYGSPLSNRTVTLNPGWNGLPVLSECNVDLMSLISGIQGIIFIKDMGSTQTYWPDGGIMTLNQLVPGKAYFIKVSQPVQITFPPCQN